MEAKLATLLLGSTPTILLKVAISSGAVKKFNNYFDQLTYLVNTNFQHLGVKRFGDMGGSGTGDGEVVLQALG